MINCLKVTEAFRNTVIIIENIEKIKFYNSIDSVKIIKEAIKLQNL